MMNYIIVIFTLSFVCVYSIDGQLEGNHHCFRELQNLIYVWEGVIISVWTSVTTPKIPYTQELMHL